MKTQTSFLMLICTCIFTSANAEMDIIVRNFSKSPITISGEGIRSTKLEENNGSTRLYFASIDEIRTLARSVKITKYGVLHLKIRNIFNIIAERAEKLFANGQSLNKITIQIMNNVDDPLHFNYALTNEETSPIRPQSKAPQLTYENLCVKLFIDKNFDALFTLLKKTGIYGANTTKKLALIMDAQNSSLLTPKHIDLLKKKLIQESNNISIDEIPALIKHEIDERFNDVFVLFNKHTVSFPNYPLIRTTQTMESTLNSVKL